MSELMALKQQLYNACRESLQKREQTIRSALQDAQAAANEETKSSAGDKHETGRAMMQLETEKLSAQLQEIIREQEKLQRIRPDKPCLTVEPGALVMTDKLRLYFAVSAGKIMVEEQVFFALSAQTPLGKVALGKQEGDLFTLQQQQYLIKKIS